MFLANEGVRAPTLRVKRIGRMTFALFAAGLLCAGGAAGAHHSFLSSGTYTFGSGQEAWGQRAKITASDGQQNDFFGFASAISGDTIVVGMSSYNRSEAYLFVKPVNGWTNTTETAKLTASDGPVAGFGSSVAISGNTVVVAAPGSGGVYVYVEPATGWTDMTETAKLTAGSDNEIAAAISDDTIVFGSDQNQDYVFVRPSGGWQTTSTPTTTLQFPVWPCCQNGGSVGVSNGIVAVGVPGNFYDEGTVYLYVKPSGGWPQIMNPTATLIASDAAFNDELGTSIFVGKNTVVAGAPYHSGTGAAYIFEKPSGGWANMTQTAELAKGDGSATATAVALISNGKMVMTGSPMANVGTNRAQGAAYLFAKPTTGWKTTRKFSAKFSASDGAPNDEFGASVAISGITAVAGAPMAAVYGGYGQGAAYVFVK